MSNINIGGEPAFLLIKKNDKMWEASTDAPGIPNHQYDCDNCWHGTPGEVEACYGECGLSDILHRISVEEIREINTRRLLQGKSAVGMDDMQ